MDVKSAVRDKKIIKKKRLPRCCLPLLGPSLCKGTGAGSGFGGASLLSLFPVPSHLVKVDVSQKHVPAKGCAESALSNDGIETTSKKMLQWSH